MSNPTQLSTAKQRLLEKFLKGEVARQTWDGPVERRAPGAPTPLAPNQQQLLLHTQMAPDTPVYNESVTLHYRGHINRETLELAFNEFLRRHESWRTAFATIEDTVLQAVYDNFTVQLPMVDLTMLHEPERDAEMIRVATADTIRKFDLSVGPLVRPRLFKMADEYYRLHIAVHHLVMDGMSLERVLLPELGTIYGSYENGFASPLPEPQLQYGDYSVWQARMLANGVADAQMEHWRKVLTTPLPLMELPADHPRPSTPLRGEVEAFEISHEMRDSLHELARSQGATFYMVLLASFKTLLHRYSGGEDILVGAVTDSRKRPEFAQLMGYFLNATAMRTHPKASTIFSDYLAEVKDAVLGALSNSDVPFDHVARELRLRSDGGRQPVFQVMFSVAAPQASDSKWELRQLDISTGASKFDLYLHLEDRAHALTGRFFYSTDLFEQSTIQRLIGHWLRLIEGLLANPSTALSDLPMLHPAEIYDQTLLRHGPQRRIPSRRVHELFEAHALTSPKAVAVSCDTVRLTYGELNQEANRLARRLVEAGVGPESLVALRLERSNDLVVALLAIMKSGGAYLPLDPALPKDRQEFILHDAQPAVLLTSSDLADSLPSNAAQVVYCDEGLGTSRNLDIVVNPDSLAYVLYTSGSTGTPKGVEITHRALSNFLQSMQREPGFTKNDSLLAVTTLSFDIAGLEVFLPLISGGRLSIATRDEARDPELLKERILKSRCSVMQATPATWRALVAAGWRGRNTIKVLCGGEAMPQDLSEALFHRAGEVWNMYGPTETTIWSTIHKVVPSLGSIPIGHPIDNTEVYILDAQHHLVPFGVPGELYIGGAGVARGYLHRPELTAERFITVHALGASRLYRTGDRARWLSDGALECLGRVDNQLKIRGFRIEPEEIEAVLLTHPEIHSAAVKAWPDTSGNLSLAGYVVAEGEPDLRAFLAERLPDYMVPSRFLYLENMPLTPNLKVDRKALAPPMQVGSVEIKNQASDELERRLSSAFASTLGLSAVGTRDNFFDLGGHSLLAASLLRKIENETGVRLYLPAVFQAPTVERLAAMIRNQGFSLGGAKTVEISKAATGAPLFWTSGGQVFAPLAELLGARRSLIPVLRTAELTPLAEGCRAEEIAGLVVNAMRAIQPRGPYLLGGWCADAVIAYEAAVQLRAAGDEVELLVMIDAPNPTQFRTVSPQEQLKSKLQHRLQTARRVSSGSMLGYGWAQAKSWLFRSNNTEAAVTPEELKAHLAAYHYDPKPYAGRIAVFEPQDRPSIRDLAASWSGAPAPGLHVYTVPGNHLSIFSTPNVEKLVDRIEACIARAQSAQESESIAV